MSVAGFMKDVLFPMPVVVGMSSELGSIQQPLACKHSCIITTGRGGGGDKGGKSQAGQTPWRSRNLQRVDLRLR